MHDANRLIPAHAINGKCKERIFVRKEGIIYNECQLTPKLAKCRERRKTLPWQTSRPHPLWPPSVPLVFFSNARNVWMRYTLPLPVPAQAIY